MLRKENVLANDRALAAVAVKPTCVQSRMAMALKKQTWIGVWVWVGVFVGLVLGFESPRALAIKHTWKERPPLLLISVKAKKPLVTCFLRLPNGQTLSLAQLGQGPGSLPKPLCNTNP